MDDYQRLAHEHRCVLEFERGFLDLRFVCGKYPWGMKSYSMANEHKAARGVFGVYKSLKASPEFVSARRVFFSRGSITPIMCAIPFEEWGYWSPS